jgi:uncharacterized membrane protein YfcA
MDLIALPALTYLNSFLLFATSFLAESLNTQAIIMAVGGSLGGYAIARRARKIPTQTIRWLVSIVAVSMTTYFFMRG